MSSSGSDKKRRNYKFLGMLPTTAPHALRVRVFHHILGREVEFRILGEGTPKPAEKIFFRELKDLVLVDHPAFLPILQRGRIRGNPCYTIPLRYHPTLADLLEDETFRLEDRCLALRSVASGMCAAHLRGICTGAPAAQYIAWDAVAATAYFLHHLMPPEVRPAPEGLRYPGGVDPRGPTDKSADVFHWGVFAYYLLTHGQVPDLDAAGVREALLLLAPGLDPNFAATVEACLAADPDIRPRDGAELNTVLQVDIRNRGEGDQVIDLSDDGDELTPQAVSQSLAKLRETGKIPAALPAPPPDTPESREPSDQLPKALLGELEKPGVDLLTDHDPAEDPPDPAPVDPRFRAANRGGGGRGKKSSVMGMAPVQTNEWSRRQAGLLEGLVAGFIAGFAIGGWAFYLTSDPAPAPGVTAPVRPSRPGGGGGDPGDTDPPDEELVLTALPPSVQAKYQGDRFIRRLLRRDFVAPEEFDETWKVVRMLSIRKRLPKAINDRVRVMKIRKTYDADADQGARMLTDFLEDLRTMVGEAEENGS